MLGQLIHHCCIELFRFVLHLMVFIENLRCGKLGKLVKKYGKFIISLKNNKIMNKQGIYSTTCSLIAIVSCQSMTVGI